MMIDPRPYAALCAEAYTARPDIQAGAAKAIIRETALGGFAARPYDGAGRAGRAIAFQGTHDAGQVLADLDIGPRRVDGLGDVHDGIWAAMRAIAIRADVAAGDAPLILAGHSLGAAIAIALAVHRTMMGKPPAALIGFGPPRVGLGPAIRRVLASAGVTVRLYRNGIDAVPDLPLPFLWTHAGALTRIGTAGDPIDDHAIDSYIAALHGREAA